MAEQLLLFHTPRSDIEEINEELTEVIEKLDRYRKSMHAKLTTLNSEVKTLQTRIDIQDAQMYILKTYLETHFEKSLEDQSIVNFA